MKILQNIAFLAHQGLPLRGDGNEDDSNYIQLLNLRAIDDPRIIEWLQKRSDKYTSSVIQNEILKIMALKVIQKIAKFLQGSEFFTIMADETADASNKEQVVICLFVCDGWTITLRHTKNSLGCIKSIQLMLVHCIK